MTKKHFTELAMIMKANEKNIPDVAFIRMCNELADFCARYNPNFDRAKFLAACGVE